MTRQVARRDASDGEWSGRLLRAREFQAAARDLITLASGASYNGAVALMIHAAIAFADAITAKRQGVVNRQDHQAATKLLREVLGSDLPDKQEKFFRRALARKDEVNYGARSTAREDAERLLDELNSFATWAETMLD